MSYVYVPSRVIVAVVLGEVLMLLTMVMVCDYMKTIMMLSVWHVRDWYQHDMIWYDLVWYVSVWCSDDNTDFQCCNYFIYWYAIRHNVMTTIMISDGEINRTYILKYIHRVW